MVRTAENIAASKALEIRVHPSGRDLVSGPQNEPFFWQADTAWELFHRLDESEAKHYLDTRAKQGFNVVFVVIFAEHGGLTLPNRYGEWPFANKATDGPYDPDVFNPNPRYHDFVDTVIDYAASVGIRIALQPVWGSYVNGVYHRTVTPFDNTAAARSYGKYVAERYPYTPWLNGGDTMRWWFPEANWVGREGGPVREPYVKVIDYGAVFDAFAEGITEGEAIHRTDGSNPFIAFHPAARWLPDTPPAYASAWFGDRDWLTIDGIQSGHAVFNSYHKGVEPGFGQIQSFLGFDSVDYVRHMYAANTNPPRPVIDLEPHYESTHHNFRPELPLWRLSDIREGAWQAVFAGAAGVTYGVNSVWQMNNRASKTHPPIQHGTVAEHDWFDELELPGALHVGILVRWVMSRPSFRRVPDQGMIVSDTYDRAAPDGKDGHVVAAMRAEDGSWGAVYTPKGVPFGVELGRLRDGVKRARWFNPQTGEEGSMDVVTAGVMTPPSEGVDWVWFVQVE